MPSMSGAPREQADHSGEQCAWRQNYDGERRNRASWSSIAEMSVYSGKVMYPQDGAARLNDRCRDLQTSPHRETESRNLAVVDG